MWIEALLLAVALALEIAVFVVALRSHNRHTALAAALERASAHCDEQERRLRALDELRENRDMAEQFVGSSSRVIRNLHRGFSDIPDNFPDAARAAVALQKNISSDVADAAATLRKAFRGRTHTHKDSDSA